MTPDERQMLMDLFDRMRAHGPIEKDRDAEQLIWNEVRQIPDSAYMLVQSVLVQEEALKAANARVEELEEQVRQMQSAGRGASDGGGFLRRGGSASAGQSANPWGSAARDRDDEPSRPASPWANSGRSGSRTVPPQQVPPMPQSQPQAQQRSGGGFLKSAMATAAGVAGGMILMDSIKNMMGMGNGSAQAGENGDLGSNDPSANDVTPASQDFGNNDPGSFTETSDGGWGDSGGDDGSFEL